MFTPRALVVSALLLGAIPGCFAQTTIFEEPLSPRIANYDIDVTLDVTTKRLVGREMLLWHNKTEHPVSDLRFHLFLNGFRNDRQSFLAESGGSHRGNKIDASGFGFTEVRDIRVLPHQGDGGRIDFNDPSGFPKPEEMVTKLDAMAFMAPDDQNEHDRTFFSIPLDEPLPPGGSIWVEIKWDAKLPQPPFARTGAKEEFFMVAQWFPKIAVFKDDGTWNSHQFHLNTEFFADYGVYNVKMTVPEDYRVGATGLEYNIHDSGDGTKIHFYHAEDVHDFAWTTSNDFVEGFTQAQDVRIRVLCPTDHASQMQRMLDAAVFSVEYFQNYYGDYPYPNLTVVDPRRGASGAGGMEYPTLITTGTVYGLPMGVRALEIVTLHEFGHNYWYHLLGSNEWEESWLDEGINTYTEARIMEDKYGSADVIDFMGMKVGSVQTKRAGYLNSADMDPTVRDGWTYYSNGSYGTNSYSKPGLILLTLQNYVGKAKMDEVMRAYVARWRFKHPTSRDFMDVVNDVTGENYDWFFDQALYTRHRIDYGVSYVESRKEKKPRGFDLTLNIDEDLDSTSEDEPEEGTGYRSVVKIRRYGEFVFPVEVAFTFADGEVRREIWDGKELWKRYELREDKKLVSAAVDPDYKIPLDVNYINNSRRVKPNVKPAARATSNILAHLQTLIDFMSL